MPSSECPWSERAYPRENGVPRLLRSVVAFVDLLGTSPHASESSAQSTLVKLDTALRRARQESSIDEGLSWHHTSWFSDNLAVCAPLPHSLFPNDRLFEEASLGFVFVTLIWLQFQLAIERVALRGGVTVGNQFADNEINFGPALVKAVKLEKEAMFPRIVVDDVTLAVVDEHFYDHFVLADNPFHHELMQAPDKSVFVSYLGVVFESDDVTEMHKMLTLHRSALEDMRMAHRDGPEDIVRKYEWLAGYHNAFCSAFFADWTELLFADVAVEAGFVPYKPSADD